MRFLYCLLLAVISLIPCDGQTIFNAHTISGAQNDYISSHAIDPLGNKCLSPLIGCAKSEKQICNAKLGKDDKNKTSIYA